MTVLTVVFFVRLKTLQREDRTNDLALRSFEEIKVSWWGGGGVAAHIS